MKPITLCIFSFIVFWGIACSSTPQGDNSQPNQQTTTIPIQNNPKIENAAPQPIIYHDKANIPQLQSGYGTFGTHEVATKDINNTRYDYKPDYKALHLQTTLYYPKDLPLSRPTLFFYSGYGMHDPSAYKGLFYFVASKGYNIIFLTCPRVELGNLPAATRDAIAAFSSHIDIKKVGFIGHSMGAGVTFWMANTLADEVGDDVRILFPMASGYTVFNDSRLIPATKAIHLPQNSKMILQVYARDYSTDIRIGMDIFLNTDIQDKEYMLIYGDSQHIADHGSCMSKNGYDVDAMMQRSIYKALDALMDEGFNDNHQAREKLMKSLQDDPYFHPYIGKMPDIEIDKQYILPQEHYPFNCSIGGGVVSQRKEYCNALGL